MEQFFISYSRDCDFWSDDGSYRHPSQEFWNWAEIMLGERVPLGDEPTAEQPWGIMPGNALIPDPSSEDGQRYDNGRFITFYDPTLAMLFKLRWI